MWNVQRGAVVDIDPENARRYMVSGLATADLKVDPLPPPYRSTPESEALRTEVMKKVGESVPLEARRPAQRLIGSRYSRGQMGGWIQ
jgi:hypothetical protein